MYLRIATSPAGINFPLWLNLHAIVIKSKAHTINAGIASLYAADVLLAANVINPPKMTPETSDGVDPERKYPKNPPKVTVSANAYPTKSVGIVVPGFQVYAKKRPGKDAPFYRTEICT